MIFIFLLLACFLFATATVNRTSSTSSPPLNPVPDQSKSVQGSSDADYGKYFLSCSGDCDSCLMPGWCRDRSICGQCKCVEGKVCVPSGGIGCTATDDLVTLHNQDVQDGSVLYTACVQTEGDAVWLPRCDTDIPCPGKGWFCDKNTAFRTINNTGVFLCRPK